MDDELTKLAQRLARDGEKTVSFFRSLGPKDWDVRVYTTGSEWAVKHILAHFVSAERSFHLLIRDVAGGGEGAPRDLDIDEFNESEVPRYENEQGGDLLQSYAEARNGSVRMTENLESPDLDRRGYHPWFGEVSLRDMLKLVYRHNMIHLRDIRKALSQGGPVPHRDIEPPAKTMHG
jgi:hypothetical protein